jgi:membrane protein
MPKSEAAEDLDNASEDAPRLSVRDRIETVRRALMRRPLVRLALDVINGYNVAGAGLLSAGLAFGALFAIVPGLLAIVGLLGILIDDAATREQIVNWIVQQVPPLQQVATTVVDSLVSGSRVASVVGLIGVIWGASGFYGSLDNALSRLFPGPGTRGVIQQRIRGIIGVFALVGTALVGVVVNSVIGLAASRLNVPGADSLQTIGPLGSCLIGVAVVGIVLVVVPRSPPSPRAALWPSILGGVAIGLLTALFGLLEPYLVKGFAALGIIASVFAALIWLNFTFQILLYSAAWACVRRDRERARTTEPTL